ncbi:MAG: hypothetical protein NTV88_06035 [Candidatus Micrarchaeota archaeon]|nr:hypothetical protein [Candidatus Micrarchaeota archaeon]
MTEQTTKKARMQMPKDAPYQIFKLLPYSDTVLDTVSKNAGKKARSDELFVELKNSRQKAKEEYDKKKLENVQGKALLVCKHEFDYLDTVLANMVNLTNSFETMQTVWHLKTDEITKYYDSKIGAGGFMSNVKRFVPWLFTPVVVIASALTGAWGDVHQIIADNVATWYVNLAKTASDIIGVAGLVGISTLINQKANNWVHNIRKERDEKLKHFFVQESQVRIAIRNTIQQVALGLSAEFGYTNELKRVKDNELIAVKGNLEKIWQIVSERVKGIQHNLPVAIRDLFASSLDLPEYVASIASQQQKDTKQPEQKSDDKKTV